MKGFFSFAQSIGRLLSQKRAQDSQEAYYEAVTRARLRTIENNKILTRSENELQLKLADVSAASQDIQANELFADAFELANVSVQNLERGFEVASYNVGQARNAFASAGAAQSGSVHVTVNSIANRTFRDVDSQFKQSIDRVNQTLSQSATVHHEAALTVFNAESTALLRQMRADVSV